MRSPPTAIMATFALCAFAALASPCSADTHPRAPEVAIAIKYLECNALDELTLNLPELRALNQTRSVPIAAQFDLHSAQAMPDMPDMPTMLLSCRAAPPGVLPTRAASLDELWEWLADIDAPTATVCSALSPSACSLPAMRGLIPPRARSWIRPASNC